MLSLSTYLTEQKNTHMEHLEDSVLNGGVDGTREAINFLRGTRDGLTGNAKKSVDITTKWDGAPAIFAGTDPSDGKFFVAKKGIFNKNPKVYKTNADVDADTGGDLNTKMKLALAELPKLGIKGVIQGDFLYAKEDIKKVDIDGEPHLTFHPNTIVYAVPEKTDLAKTIRGSKIGVVWHTTYRGKSFESMSASFGKEIASGLRTTKSVWSVDAVYRDISGKAMMTKEESEEFSAILSEVGKIFAKLDKNTLDSISKNEELLLRIKTFMNTKVRAGQRIGDTTKFTSDLVDYLLDYFGKEDEKRKTPRGKEGVTKRKEDVMKFFQNTDKKKIQMIFDLMNLLVDAKLILIKKMDQAKSINTLLRTKDGYKVTGQEGFVAIDKKGNAVKLVDRLQFSNANFSSEFIKGWQR
jgi:hypothetical protein